MHAWEEEAAAKQAHAAQGEPSVNKSLQYVVFAAIAVLGAVSLGFIAPVADGGTTDLVSRQDAVMGTVRESVAAIHQLFNRHVVGFADCDPGMTVGLRFDYVFGGCHKSQ